MQPQRRGRWSCLSGFLAWINTIFTNPSYSDNRERGNSAYSAPVSYEAPQLVTPGVSFSRAVCATSTEGERDRLLTESIKRQQVSSREMDGVPGGKRESEGGIPKVPSGLSLKKGRRGMGSTLSLADDDEHCPTCLEAYTVENPKIMTKCQHHFHLACIYEWLERANTCPVCFRVMSFDEIS